MKRNCSGTRPFAVLQLTLVGLFGAGKALTLTAAAGQERFERLARLTMPFVENRGQWDRRVAYSAPTFFGTVFVTQEGELVYSLPPQRQDRSRQARRARSTGWTLTETFLSGEAVPRSGPRSPVGVSYFRGKDPRRWQSKLPSYEEIRLGEVWRGVSVCLRAHGGNVEKFFTVQPGASVKRIRLRVKGAISLRIDREGSLVMETRNGDVRFTQPEAYQERDGARQSVAAAYVLEGSAYGFRLGRFDPAFPVVIDPLLQSTYLGGAEADYIEDDAITVDPSSGDVLVAGATESTDFPGTVGGAQPALVPIGDGFVVRLDPLLTTLLQATYLGGDGLEIAQAIAVHPVSGEVFVAGSTDSTDFPGTSGGAQDAYGGGAVDGFVARLDRTLTSLLQATYLGGRGFDRCFRMSLLSNGGEVLVAGFTGSEGFPRTALGAQPAKGGGEYDGFLARLSATLTTLLQATYLGGAGEDFVLCLAVHPSSGEILAAGSTTSTDFPATAGGAQPISESNGDAFAARLNPGLTALLQTTYLGGGDLDFARGLVAHPTTGEVLVAGFTQSIDFPGTAGGVQSEYPGGVFSGFASRLDSSLTALIQSTFLGGISGGGQVSAVVVLPRSGELLLAGATISTDFPATAGGAQSENGGDVDGVVSRLDPSLTAIRQSTYLGGSTEDYIWAMTVDPTSGEILVAGWADSVDFPSTPGAVQPGFGGGIFDAFVARVTADLAAPATERLPVLPVERPSPSSRTIPARD